MKVTILSPEFLLSFMLKTQARLLVEHVIRAVSFCFLDNTNGSVFELFGFQNNLNSSSTCWSLHVELEMQHVVSSQSLGQSTVTVAVITDTWSHCIISVPLFLREAFNFTSEVSSSSNNYYPSVIRRREEKKVKAAQRGLQLQWIKCYRLKSNRQHNTKSVEWARGVTTPATWLLISLC